MEMANEAIAYPSVTNDQCRPTPSSDTSAQWVLQVGKCLASQMKVLLENLKPKENSS